MAVVVIVMVLYTLPHQPQVGATEGTRSLPVATGPLLDRNAERSPQSSRAGGPGGQVGDVP